MTGDTENQDAEKAHKIRLRGVAGGIYMASLKHLACSYIASVGDLRGDLQSRVTYQQTK